MRTMRLGRMTRSQSPRHLLVLLRCATRPNERLPKRGRVDFGEHSWSFLLLYQSQARKVVQPHPIGFLSSQLEPSEAVGSQALHSHVEERGVARLEFAEHFWKGS